MKFEEYKQMIPEARSFFGLNDTTFQSMNASNVSLNVLVDKSIVETIIGRLLIAEMIQSMKVYVQLDWRL